MNFLLGIVYIIAFSLLSILMFTWPYFIYLILGSIVLLGILSFVRRQIVIFPVLSIFFGTMTILSGWVAASFWLDEYIPKIMGIGGLTILFVVGVLTILPLKYSKNFFIRVINYLLSGILILMLVFSFIFFFSIQSNKFYGDWLAIPLTIVGSLLVGLFCLPFLIYKSWRFKKVAKNYNE